MVEAAALGLVIVSMCCTVCSLVALCAIHIMSTRMRKILENLQLQQRPQDTLNTATATDELQAGGQEFNRDHHEPEMENRLLRAEVHADSTEDDEGVIMNGNVAYRALVQQACSVDDLDYTYVNA